MISDSPSLPRHILGAIPKVANIVHLDYPLTTAQCILGDTLVRDEVLRAETLHDESHVELVG